MFCGRIIMAFHSVGTLAIHVQQICSQLFCIVIVAFWVATELDIDTISVRDAVFSFTISHCPDSILMRQYLIDASRIHIIMHSSCQISCLHSACMGRCVSPRVLIVSFIDNNTFRIVFSYITIFLRNSLNNVQHNFSSLK